jgi:hypothetical protein
MKLLAILLLGALGAGSCGGDAAPVQPSDFVISVTTDPSPPIVGRNMMRIHVTDLAGNAVEGATLAVDPQMPSHGHGSPEVPVLMDKGGGNYEAFPLSLIMKGRWEVTVDAKWMTKLGKQTFPVDVP